MTEALSTGILLFQYRNKTASRGTIYAVSLILARIAHQAGALFIVNDHADIAAAVDADGVHLGQDDIPIEHARKLLGSNKIIGISTHSREQAIEAEQRGADYIGFGPIFPTSTKEAGAAQGLAQIETIKQSIMIPMLAIGGINHANVQSVLRAGADGVAVISSILSAADIASAAREMMKTIASMRGA